MKSFVRALLVLGALALSFAVRAEEGITMFASDVALAADGSAHVVEQIEVVTEGRKIRHGVFRDIPTVLTNEDFSRHYSELTVTGVWRGETPEPYRVENIEGGKRIVIGDIGIWLDPGIYAYTIEYTMTRVGRRFADHDELYWNVTGNFWDFPILAAGARITLPDGAVLTDLQGYTGALGSTEQAVEISREGDTSAIFVATRLFDIGEGLTLSASFDKGVLVEPTDTQALIDYLSDHRALVLPVGLLAVVLGYNLLAWLLIGRDPIKGTIIPLFYPPEGLSPAMVHYVHHMRWMNDGWQAFTAGLIDLAVRRLIILRPGDPKDRNRRTSISTTDQTSGDLSAEEHQLLAYLRTKKHLTVDRRTGPDLGRQLERFKTAALNATPTVYFRNNIAATLVSLALCLVSAAVMYLTGVLDVVAIAVEAVLGFLMLTGYAFFSKGRFGAFANYASAIYFFGVVFVVVLTCGWFLLDDLFSSVYRLAPFAIMLAILVVSLVFIVVMRAPTREGRAVMDLIDGFAMYVRTAEKQRLNFEKEPQMTIARFETILPYAVALGLEENWTERFEADLARNAVPDARGGTYRPRWGAQSALGAASLAAGITSISGGLASSMASAQPSSSSSGGGGGGSSGGGSGGGGGGGW